MLHVDGSRDIHDLDRGFAGVQRVGAGPRNAPLRPPTACIVLTNSRRRPAGWRPPPDQRRSNDETGPRLNATHAPSTRCDGGRRAEVPCAADIPPRRSPGPGLVQPDRDELRHPWLSIVTP